MLARPPYWCAGLVLRRPVLVRRPPGRHSDVNVSRHAPLRTRGAPERLALGVKDILAAAGTPQAGIAEEETDRHRQHDGSDCGRGQQEQPHSVNPTPVIMRVPVRRPVLVRRPPGRHPGETGIPIIYNPDRP